MSKTNRGHYWLAINGPTCAAHSNSTVTTEAILFCRALREGGAFGTVINQSVRVVSYWQKLADLLIRHFETGPVMLSPGDVPYEEPHVDVRLDSFGSAGLEKDNPRRVN